MTIKILNLYAGIGGNRKLWTGDIRVVAVELNPQIAAIYKDFFPQDEVIVADAHQYLLEHFKEFDFIWASPPCPSHSQIRFIGSKVKDETDLARKRTIIYPDMKLYEEIILLTNYFEGKWLVENVASYYEPLIKPTILGRHYYWSNFPMPKANFPSDKICDGSVKELQKHNGFVIEHYDIDVDKKVLLRNCVNPKAGLYLFELAFRKPQTTLS